MESADVPEMADWIVDRLGDEPVMWLDEVFANRQLKPSGNLQNFGKFVTGLAVMLDCTTVAYRTVEPKMTTKPIDVFGDQATILTRKGNVPDRRDFVTIRNVKDTL